MLLNLGVKAALLVPFESTNFPSLKVMFVAVFKVEIRAASASIFPSQNIRVEIDSPKFIVVRFTANEPEMLLQPAVAVKLFLVKSIDPVADSQVNKSSTATIRVLSVAAAGAWRVMVPPTSAAAGEAIISSNAIVDPVIIFFISD